MDGIISTFSTLREYVSDNMENDTIYSNMTNYDYEGYLPEGAKIELTLNRYRNLNIKLSKEGVCTAKAEIRLSHGITSLNIPDSMDTFKDDNEVWVFPSEEVDSIRAEKVLGKDICQVLKNIDLIV